MIALLDGMPLVALPDGRNTVFDKSWITCSLRHAAEHAGYNQWGLAEHIAESVALYLKRDFGENCVAVVNLQEAVADVLRSLGFVDVAACFRLPDPPLHLSLAELVRQAGDGYELAFFGLLGERLQRMAGSRSSRLEIDGLSECLRLLSRRGGKGRREGLREEIVGFIRQYGSTAGSAREGDPLEIQLT